MFMLITHCVFFSFLLQKKLKLKVRQDYSRADWCVQLNKIRSIFAFLFEFSSIDTSRMNEECSAQRFANFVRYIWHNPCNICKQGAINSYHDDDVQKAQ